MSARAAWQLSQAHTWEVLCTHSQDMQTWGFPQDKCTGLSWRPVNFSKRKSSSLSCHCHQQKGKASFWAVWICQNSLLWVPLGGIISDSTEWEQPLCVFAFLLPATAFPRDHWILDWELTQRAFKAVALIIWHLLDTCHSHIWAESPAFSGKHLLISAFFAEHALIVGTRASSSFSLVALQFHLSIFQTGILRVC